MDFNVTNEVRLKGVWYEFRIEDWSRGGKVC